MHQHAKGQLTYVEGGLAYLHLKGSVVVIPARHYIWVPKHTDHFLQAGLSATAVRTVYYYNHDDGDDDFYNRLGIYPINSLLHEMILYTAKWNGSISPGSKPFTFLAALKNLLPKVGVKNLPIILPTTLNERLRPVLIYLSTHFSQPLTLQKVSDHFGMSERSLSRLFQLILSISFLQYLKQLRMVRAIEMMLRKDMNLSQIAYATGYNSISAFSNTFYQVTQTRPSEFASTVR